MLTHKIIIVPIVAILIATAIGCDDDENQCLADMAEKHLQRQAEQNRRMAELQQEVAEGARQLIEADAQARQEMVALHREVQGERVEIGRQRDALEGDRRDFAARRHLDPVIAATIWSVGLLLACLLPLVLCLYLLHRPVDPADDQVVAELLLEDLVIERPLLLPRNESRQSLGVREIDDTPQLSDERIDLTTS